MDEQDLIAAGTDPATHRPWPILVAVKTAESLPSLLIVARTMERLFITPLLLAHVSPDRMPCQALAQRLGLAPEALQGLTVIPESGDPAERLLGLATDRRCGLVILGAPRTLTDTTGPSGVAERLLEAAPCPVLVVPETVTGAWGGAGRILVPLDGTPSTAGVVWDATHLASRFGAAMDVVYVADGGLAPTEPGAMRIPWFVDEPQHEWRLWRQEFLERFCLCDLPETPVHLSVRMGPIAPAILTAAEARGSDLIAIGWHGRFTGGHAAVMRTLLLQAPCPMLVVRVPAKVAADRCRTDAA